MLTDRFLARLDALRLVMRGRAQGGAGGSRRSRQTGSSAEFSDYREYIPGDDIRRLDWNALARFDRLYMKLFMEEQESQVMILLDASASMEDKWSAARSAARERQTEPAAAGISCAADTAPRWQPEPPASRQIPDSKIGSYFSYPIIPLRDSSGRKQSSNDSLPSSSR